MLKYRGNDISVWFGWYLWAAPTDIKIAPAAHITNIKYDSSTSYSESLIPSTMYMMLYVTRINNFVQNISRSMRVKHT